MKTIAINLNKLRNQDILEIAKILKNGGVIVYPTDTVYGLGCAANQEKAIKKILSIKQREPNKGLIILINSYKMLRQHCLINKKQLNFLKHNWPGPVSALLKSKNNLPPILSGGSDFLVVRMPKISSQKTDLPKRDFLTRIIKELKTPLVSTSLNLSGEKTLTNLNQINVFFKEKPDLLVDAGPLKTKKPSKIVDLTDPDRVKIIRK